MVLETKRLREQNGRDAISRYKAQYRSAAVASLSILEGKEVDRVYCDLHDDFVIRKKRGDNHVFLFYQVKTKDKQNHNWTVIELFGIKTTSKKVSVEKPEDISDSFIGKMLLHAINFPSDCEKIIFQTNINIADSVETIFDEIQEGKFTGRVVEFLIEKFNKAFKSATEGKDLSIDEIKNHLQKILIEPDVQYLKNGEVNFEPIVRDKIYQFSEVTLEYTESREIVIKLLDLIQRKSSGVIKNITRQSIEELAGVSIDDLLSVLSISKDAYRSLLEGGDQKAIKSASIIQRTLEAAEASSEVVEFCSRCKINWDLWVRNNRHLIPEIALHSLIAKIRKILKDSVRFGNSIDFDELRMPILSLLQELKSENICYDINEELILGAIFSELVKGKT